MMKLYIVKEPEPRDRLVRNTLSFEDGEFASLSLEDVKSPTKGSNILMQNKRRAAAGVDESRWAGQIPSVRFDEGCGPDLLRKAFDTCARLGAESLESQIPRNGNPDHYISLFSYDEDDAIRYPSRQMPLRFLRPFLSQILNFRRWRKSFISSTAVTDGMKRRRAVIWIPKQNSEGAGEYMNREESEPQEMDLH